MPHPIVSALLFWGLAAALSVQGGIVINELMYNPVGGSDYEFIELHNTGPVDLDLNGYSFSGGVTYTFSSLHILEVGEFLVLAGNPAVFLTRYPAVTPLAPGTYAGKLNNDGETLRTQHHPVCAKAVLYRAARKIRPQCARLPPVRRKTGRRFHPFHFSKLGR
jgi:hypothetical protein